MKKWSWKCLLWNGKPQATVVAYKVNFILVITSKKFEIQWQRYSTHGHRVSRDRLIYRRTWVSFSCLKKRRVLGRKCTRRTKDQLYVSSSVVSGSRGSSPSRTESQAGGTNYEPHGLCRSNKEVVTVSVTLANLPPGRTQVTPQVCQGKIPHALDLCHCSFFGLVGRPEKGVVTDPQGVSELCPYSRAQLSVAAPIL